MNSSNQDTSGYNISYDPNVAYEFFKLFGKLELAKADEKFFVEGHKAKLFSLQTDKMYFLMEGKVTIETALGCVLDIEPGELFGEFTPYTTRNATATAKLSSKLLTLSEKQLLTGLQKKPEFLLMLMDVLVNYIEKAGRETKKANVNTQDATQPTENSDSTNDSTLISNLLNDLKQKLGIEDSKHYGTLNSKVLHKLKQKLGDSAVMVVPEKQPIIKEGAVALLMYVIVDGFMTISVGNKVIHRSGPGEIVGEIALVTQHARSANVITETNCSLLSINRQTLMELLQTLPCFGIAFLRVLASRLHISSTTPGFNLPESSIEVSNGEYNEKDWDSP